MSSYIYAYEAKLEVPLPGYMVYDREQGGKHFYLSDRELDFPAGTIVGAWNNDGSVLHVDGVPVPIDPLFDALRPVGNVDGAATDQLGYHYIMGHGQRHVQAAPEADSDPRYPADNQPIVLTMDRRWDDTPGWEGWGWECWIEFSDPNRTPTARAIATYDENWASPAVAASFTLADAGEGVQKYRTYNPPGSATAEKEEIRYALLHGSAQEGKMALPLDTDSQENYFFEADQVIPGEEWVDSGETVTGMAGTVTLVSDVAPFPVGTQVRIEGVEMAVTSIWAGQGLVLAPYRASTTGAVIEKWQ